MDYYNKYHKYKNKYLNLKLNGGSNIVVNDFNLTNFEMINKHYKYDEKILDELQKIDNEFYNDFIYLYIMFLKIYIYFTTINFVEFDIKNKKVNKKLAVEIIPCCSIIIYNNNSNSNVYLKFIEDGKKELKIESNLIGHKNIIFESDDGEYNIYEINGHKVLELINGKLYISNLDIKRKQQIINILFKLFNLDETYNFVTPLLHGDRTGNTLFGFFKTIYIIIWSLKYEYNKIKNEKNILLINHEFIKNKLELNFNNYDLFLFKKKLINENKEYNFIETNREHLNFNLFDIKDTILNIFNYLTSDKLKNIEARTDNIVALHFRGGDYCVTYEGSGLNGFNILHFKYYYDSIVRMIETNILTNNVIIHIFSQKADQEVVRTMINYLRKKLKLNFNHIKIKFEFEYNIFQKLGVDSPNVYDTIRLISTYKYIILSNSSFVLWSGFLSTNSKLFFCHENLIKHTIPNFYLDAFESLIHKNDAELLDSTEYEYLLSCFIDIEKYFNTDKFNYHDLMMILNSLEYDNCSFDNLVEIARIEYDNKFGHDNLQNSKGNLDTYKSRVSIISQICFILSDENNINKIISSLSYNNTSPFLYDVNPAKLIKTSNLFKNLNLSRYNDIIEFVLFIILLFLAKNNDMLYCELIDSFTFNTNIKLLISKFKDIIINYYINNHN